MLATLSKFSTLELVLGAIILVGLLWWLFAKRSSPPGDQPAAMTAARDFVQEDIARGWQAIQAKYGGRVWLVLIVLALLVAAAVYLYMTREPAPQPVQPMSQKRAEQPAEQKQAAKAAGWKISDEQAEDVAEQISEAKARAPDKITPTTGGELQQTVKDELAKSGANYAVVTDPANPNTAPQLDPNKPPAHGSTTVQPVKLEPGTPVQLNQYNIFAYPKELWQVGYDTGNGVLVGYHHRVKVLGATGYLGVQVRADLDPPGPAHEPVRAAVMLTIPRN